MMKLLIVMVLAVAAGYATFALDRCSSEDRGRFIAGVFLVDGCPR